MLLQRLLNLKGKKARLKVTDLDEVTVTIVEVCPAKQLPSGTDDKAFRSAIIQSKFIVRFDQGGEIRVLGRSISSIDET